MHNSAIVWLATRISWFSLVFTLLPFTSNIKPWSAGNVLPLTQSFLIFVQSLNVFLDKAPVVSRRNLRSLQQAANSNSLANISTISLLSRSISGLFQVGVQVDSYQLLPACAATSNAVVSVELSGPGPALLAGSATCLFTSSLNLSSTITVPSSLSANKFVFYKPLKRFRLLLTLLQSVLWCARPPLDLGLWTLQYCWTESPL